MACPGQQAGTLSSRLASPTGLPSSHSSCLHYDYLLLPFQVPRGCVMLECSLHLPQFVLGLILFLRRHLHLFIGETYHLICMRWSSPMLQRGFPLYIAGSYAHIPQVPVSVSSKRPSSSALLHSSFRPAVSSILSYVLTLGLLGWGMATWLARDMCCCDTFSREVVYIPDGFQERSSHQDVVDFRTFPLA